MADYRDRFWAPLLADRTPEQVARLALESSPLMGRLIRGIHRRVLRFELGPPGDPAYVLGWRVEESSQERLRLTTSGSMYSGELVGAVDGGAVSLTTTLTFRSRRSRPVWTVVGPLHRVLAPVLLRRGAR